MTVVNEEKDYYAAMASCFLQDKKLAVLDNQLKIDMLENLLEDGETYWVNGSYKCTSREKSAGEADADCNEKNKFVCATGEKISDEPAPPTPPPTPESVAHVLAFGTDEYYDEFQAQVIAIDGSGQRESSVTTPTTRPRGFMTVKGVMYIFGDGDWDWTNRKISRLNGCSFEETSLTLTSDMTVPSSLIVNTCQSAIAYDDGDKGFFTS